MLTLTIGRSTAYIKSSYDDTVLQTERIAIYFFMGYTPLLT